MIDRSAWFWWLNGKGHHLGGHGLERDGGATGHHPLGLLDRTDPEKIADPRPDVIIPGDLSIERPDADPARGELCLQEEDRPRTARVKRRGNGGREITRNQNTLPFSYVSTHVFADCTVGAMLCGGRGSGMAIRVAALDGSGSRTTRSQRLT